MVQGLGETGLPRIMAVAIIRQELAALRRGATVPSLSEILVRVRSALEIRRQSRIRRVINATGILIHTNLGRSPLGAGTLAGLAATAGSYCNLEYDLAGGGRGSRGGYVEGALALLCGAEDALVVNNCAAALVLMVRHFTRGEKKEVVVSRGESVQIGGGFRIPEILEASGAVLREVGTTNQTALTDYARAIGPKTAMVLKVHRSNFSMEGFVSAPGRTEIAELARRKKIPLVEDLGSGAVRGMADDLEEPTANEALRQGSTLVCFSGDKLLGGPQAGIIVGRRRWMTALRREPFFRALRCDKLILSALQATVDAHLEGRGLAEIPIVAMAAATESELRKRAEKLVSALSGFPGRVSIGCGRSEWGGGTRPGSGLPSVTVDLQPTDLSLNDFADRLRRGAVPVIGFISAGKFRMDLRTVFPGEDAALADATLAAAGII